ncbi:hypothetical protein HPB47_021726 [Ixodes persulcatus]|uniref:Uncharacterized protein n=1 Tax=Ixodes persulcatus TaxID=34615 RepID=A0AC60QCQ7_IXOPE|nr:hypothetical protein HPB47_021726 [Ixodes persulcatus]
MFPIPLALFRDPILRGRHKLILCELSGRIPSPMWERQIEPLQGAQAANHLWMSRYILDRVVKGFGVIMSLHSKPFESNDLFYSGGHVNFSTKDKKATSAAASHLLILKRMDNGMWTERGEVSSTLPINLDESSKATDV